VQPTPRLYRVADEPAAGSIRAGRATVEDDPDVIERCLHNQFLGMISKEQPYGERDPREHRRYDPGSRPPSRIAARDADVRTADSQRTGSSPSIPWTGEVVTQQGLTRSRNCRPDSTPVDIALRGRHGGHTRRVTFQSSGAPCPGRHRARVRGRRSGRDAGATLRSNRRQLDASNRDFRQFIESRGATTGSRRAEVTCPPCRTSPVGSASCC